jgi:hypothetical protein
MQVHKDKERVDDLVNAELNEKEKLKGGQLKENDGRSNHS